MRNGDKNNNYKHGMARTNIWYVYFGIKNRCNNKNNKDYKYYGARGIKCEWKTFMEFYKDMGDSYKKGLEIDRMNNYGNYNKQNCRWTTRKQQNRNSSNCRFYKNKCISEWCEELGLNYNTVRWRINGDKQSVEKALRLI